jgi:DNA-binding CsgD family transcriptional regulator
MSRELPKEGARLSGREREVLGLLGQGKKTAEIAKLMGTTFKTVLTYCARLKSKRAPETCANLFALPPLASAPQINNSLAVILDGTERIEMRFFDHRGKRDTHVSSGIQLSLEIINRS